MSLPAHLSVYVMQIRLTTDDFLSYFFQNAGEGPTEHVQKGAAADRLYGVSLGTTDQRVVTQKPHRYNTACVPHCYFSRASCPEQQKSATTG